MFSHSDLFGHLKEEQFIPQDATEYLEVSMPTFGRYVQSGNVIPAEIVGRSQLFSSGESVKLKESL